MNGPSVTTSPRMVVAVGVGWRARPSPILPPFSGTCSANRLCASITCWSTSGVAVAYALSSSKMRIRYSAMLIILPFRQGLPSPTRRSAGAGIDKPPPPAAASPEPRSVVPGGAGGGLFRPLAQRLHRRRRVVGAVDRRAGHEDVRPGLRATLDGFLTHPAVHLEPHRPAVPLHERPCPAQLGQHDVEEALPAEPRLHGHQQQHVEVGP